MDYSHPDGLKITLALRRVRSAPKAKRVGVLFVMEGQPSTPGAELDPDTAVDNWRKRFDSVAFDHRGTGRSSALKCPSLTELAPGSFIDPADHQALDKLVARWLEACGTQAGPLIHFVRASDTAQDIERIRQALGERQLNISAIGYNAALASVYATLFPSQVRSLLLWSPEDPGSWSRWPLDYAHTLSALLDAFLVECTAANCAYNGPNGAKQRFDDQVTRLLTTTIPPGAGSDRESINLTVFGFVVAELIPTRDAWPVLARVLDALDHGDRTLFDKQQFRVPYQFRFGGTLGVLCANGLYPATKDAAEAVRNQLYGERATIRMWFASGAGSDVCPTAGLGGEAPPLVKNSMAVKPLIYDAKQDLGLPSVWAQRLATSLAPATLLQGPGELDRTCLEHSSEQYFLSLVLPADGACS